MPFAYWTDAVRKSPAARDHAAFARIATGGPWQFRERAHEGRAGVMAEWKDHDGSMDVYGEPRVCADGLVYFPSRIPLRQDELAKPSPPRGMEYTTAAGVTLTIPLAAAAPRFLEFGDSGPAFGDPVGDFAKLAEVVFDRLGAKSIGFHDPELRRLILLALGQCYRVTAEVLGEVRWITTADVEPVLLCMMGADPKALPDAGDSSPSPASGSPTSP